MISYIWASKYSVAPESIDNCTLPSTSQVLSNIQLLAHFFNLTLHCSLCARFLSISGITYCGSLNMLSPLPGTLIFAPNHCLTNFCSFSHHIFDFQQFAYHMHVFVQDLVNTCQKHPHTVSVSSLAGDLVLWMGAFKIQVCPQLTLLAKSHLISPLKSSFRVLFFLHLPFPSIALCSVHL